MRAPKQPSAQPFGGVVRIDKGTRYFFAGRVERTAVLGVVRDSMSDAAVLRGFLNSREPSDCCAMGR